jgi:O-antigen ligase
MSAVVSAQQHRPELPRWTLAVHLLLFVPYLTASLSWGFNNGYFPLRPAIYLLAFGLLCLLSCRGRSRGFPITSLALMGLYLLRIVDLGVLQRWDHEGENVSEAISVGSTLFLAFVGVVGIGAWLQHGGRALLWGGFATMAIGVGVNICEFLGYGEFSSVPGRAAGFLQDANDSSITIINALTICLVLLKVFWQKVACLIIAIMGIVPTFSRSGMIVYALVFLVFAALHLKTHGRKILLTVVCGIGLGSVALGAFAMTVKDENAKRRLAGIFGGDTEKMGSSERMKDLEDGLVAAQQRPLLGYGVGAGTTHWKPHNQFVAIWIEHGLLVAIGFVGLWLTIFVKCFLHHRQGILLILPHLAFIPFTQMQLESVSVLYTALLASAISCTHPLRFSLFTPRHVPSPA